MLGAAPRDGLGDNPNFMPRHKFSSVSGGHITKQNFSLLHKGRGVLISVMATLEDISLFSSFIHFIVFDFPKLQNTMQVALLKYQKWHYFVKPAVKLSCSSIWE
jgi:hypothetical protein